MKLLTTLLTVLFISISSYAQQGINYKALIKDGSGNVVANQTITVQFSVLKGVAQTNVYQETHTPTTDAKGIIIINIGEGSVNSGVYADIDWGADQHFLNVQINTGSGLVDMGTTEFMAVPYAEYATTSVKSVTRVELDALTPKFKQMVFDSTDGVILFWNGFKWLEMANFTNCFPQPTVADAGPDQTITTTTTSTSLVANAPVEGTGTWSIISGIGGSLSDVNDPLAIFTGTSCTNYTLQWVISTVCGSRQDFVVITFNEAPTIANAGSDIISITQTTVGLNANTPIAGIGSWTVVSGVGGSFSDANSPNPSFTGNNNTTYRLRWTITSSCGNTSFDEINVFIGNAIGLLNHGGIIFYVDGTGQHGLVCEISDRSGPWGCPGILISGADGTAIGTGAQNTIDIEAGCTTLGTAADICANLTLNGFSDWFLPSSDELIEMYNNRDIIDQTAIQNGGTAFILENGYISSSERNSSFGWGVRYSDGLKVQISKSITDKVRAIRAF